MGNVSNSEKRLQGLNIKVKMEDNTVSVSVFVSRESIFFWVTNYCNLIIRNHFNFTCVED